MLAMNFFLYYRCLSNSYIFVLTEIINIECEKNKKNCNLSSNYNFDIVLY